MDDRDPFTSTIPSPSATRPLLGLTVLVVEDSRFACDAMRLLCLRSGARIRRADCLRSARRHLKVYQPSVAVIDLGLPDGDGTDLIKELDAGSPRISIILGVSGDPDTEQTALNAGADGFMSKPITSLGLFQETILARLPSDRQPLGPRSINAETVEPDLLAYRDDMAHIADVLTDESDGRTLDYVAQFLGGVARSAEDAVMAKAASDLSKARAEGTPVNSAIARIAGLVQTRLDDKMAI